MNRFQVSRGYPSSLVLSKNSAFAVSSSRSFLRISAATLLTASLLSLGSLTLSALKAGAPRVIPG